MYLSHGSPELFLKITQALDLAIRADLKTLRDWYFDCLLVCTAIVGIGLILEGPEIAHDLYGIFRRKSIGLKYWLAPSIDRREYSVPAWMKVWTAVGWFLIVLGVMGEGISEGYVSWADGTLQTLNDILLSDAQKEATFAIERSAGAYERAAQTEREASQENERAAKALEAAEVARKNAEGFQFQIAQANERAAEANRTAESERLARVQLQKELQPRRLTSAQKDKLTSLLRGKPKPIFILTMGDDTETADLANDIGDALNKAGWKTFFSVRFSFEHGIEVGTSRESDMSVLMPAIEELKGALSAVGLSSRTTLFDPNDNHLAGKFEKNVLCLVIDHKPVIKAPE